MYKLVVLNLEGSFVTASCLDYLTALTSLKSLNVNRSHLLDDGCEKFLGKWKTFVICQKELTKAKPFHIVSQPFYICSTQQFERIKFGI
uniref:Uncharacterized protein n=1 Tax=Solanum lycopersicum TaxID=4081 RepID=A0A3Q7GRP4_SOLLC